MVTILELNAGGSEERQSRAEQHQRDADSGGDEEQRGRAVEDDAQHQHVEHDDDGNVQPDGPHGVLALVARQRVDAAQPA